MGSVLLVEEVEVSLRGLKCDSKCVRVYGGGEYLPVNGKRAPSADMKAASGWCRCQV